MEDVGESKNIVLFPFMAQGHIIPFLALAFRLEQLNSYNITFVNTPFNIKKLQESLPETSSIRLLEIPFNPSDHGLPPEAENTDSLPYELIFRLLQVSVSLESSFRKLLSHLISGGFGPLCVISDIFFGWTAQVTHEFGLFHATFSGSGAFGLACYYSMWMNLPHRKTDSLEFTLPDFPQAGNFHVTHLSAAFLRADGTDPWSLIERKLLPLWLYSDAMLLNTVEDIDMIGLEYFRRKTGRPVWPIGPILLTMSGEARAGRKAGITPEVCIEWLDKKEASSVLYISFGSQNTISASQIMQLAKALERTERNFIWMLRPPIGFDLNSEFKAEEWLPERFIQRAGEKERGLIVEKWAPQMEILSHRSICAFMSHCGWNSVLEALSRGVPLISWPIAAEQFFNAKLLVEEIAVCVEVARGTNFEIRHEDISEKIELLMTDNIKGNEIRSRALQVSDLIQDAITDVDNGGYKGSSSKAMEEFLSAAFLMK